VTDSLKTNLIVATRFSHLAGGATSAQTGSADLRYEALAALAESLDLLAATLSAFPGPAHVDPRRLTRLRRRTASLQHLCEADPAPKDFI
jgi:hypothetical protein